AGDGSYRWFFGRLRPIRDPAGRIVKWLGVCTDINDLKRAEAERRQALAQAEAARAEAEAARAGAEAVGARLRGRFEGSGDAIVVTDAGGRCVDINRAAVAMLGYAREECLEMRTDLLGEVMPDWTEADRQRLRAEGHWRGEVDVRPRSRAPVPVEA